MHSPGAQMASGKRAGANALARFALSTVCLLPSAFILSSCVFWTPMSHAPHPSATTIDNVPMQQWDIKSCGAGALSAVLQHHGEMTSMDEWQAALPKTRGGVMSIDLVLAARQKGFDAQLVTGDATLVEAELRAHRPVILMLQVIQAPGKGYDFFHYIVLDGYDPMKQLIRAQFGDGRARWVTLRRIMPAWKGTKFATILIRPADPNAKALRAAVQLEEEGKYALAAHAYREILQTDPRSLLAWTNLGNAEMRLGRRASAEEAFRKALELEPESADALNNLAWLLFEEKRIEEAEPLARKAVITKAPDPWLRLDTLARILLARGACDEAAMTFRQAIAQVPESRKTERAEIEAAASNIASCSPGAANGPPPSTD
jgi:PAS domain-containing protein